MGQEELTIERLQCISPMFKPIKFRNNQSRHIGVMLPLFFVKSDFNNWFTIHPINYDPNVWHVVPFAINLNLNVNKKPLALLRNNTISTKDCLTLIRPKNNLWKKETYSPLQVSKVKNFPKRFSGQKELPNHILNQYNSLKLRLQLVIPKNKEIDKFSHDVIIHLEFREPSFTQQLPEPLKVHKNPFERLKN
ncbi:hypothetical protein EGR_05499 [Echinococcus granulosus]|uniref:Uncharacterized protein n=1 Tax=Echinococcus granulosus TaxID=6210 RepID=W6UDY2_ECHGR|nr:hypothetical protein EGR_05499 [Echinococcus granulosus]EUB59600.1 hypothetical protein EGR_05499 [Echinococcus granulosus]